MTRYYDISVSPSGSTQSMFAWGSHPDGSFDPGALNVEFDMPVLPYGVPVGGQTITIEGVSLQALSQAQDFTGKNITVRGGMQKGLPLANPAQAGVLLAGQIFQSFGNWQGTEQSLSFVVLPSIYTMDNPGNLVLDWKPGQKLADALMQMFSVAYPGTPVSINIGDNLVEDSHKPNPFPTLDAAAEWVSEWTNSYFNGQQVNITMQGGRIVVYDKTYTPSPIQINFTDLIGQPTWIDKQTMQMKTVMRADVQLGSTITMPAGMQNTPGFVNTTAASLPSSLKYQSAFQNNFLVTGVRHVGNFRSSDSADWCTIFNCLTGI